MDVISVKNYLISNTDKLIEILENAGFYHIHHNENKGEIRSAWHEDGNSTSVVVNTENLLSVCFSRSIKGDVIVLLQHKLNKSFIETFQWLKGQLSGCEIVKRVPLFGGFYSGHSIGFEKEEQIYTDVYDKYEKSCNRMFWRDGISLETQVKYGLAYDHHSNRIIIPCQTENGIVGTLGRINETDFGDVPKYLAMDSYSRSNYLFGLNFNYEHILKTNLVFVGEAEKFSMQCDSMEIYNAVSVGKKSLSPTQVDMLKYLNVRIILCFDADVSEYELREECKKFENSLFGKVNIAYILDREKKYIKDKQSPTDLGREVFLKLLKECLVIYKN